MTIALADTRTRSDVYRLLAALFCQPDRDALVEAAVPENLARGLERVCPRAAPFARRLGEALAETDAEALGVEHARLFIGPYGLLAPPYGSVYLDPGGMVMGASTEAVAEAYSSEGVVLDPDAHEVPDHISAELEFLHLLCWKEARAHDEERPADADALAGKRERFLREHAAAWGPDFRGRIRENTDSDYFRSLADCVQTFLEHEVAS